MVFQRFLLYGLRVSLLNRLHSGLHYHCIRVNQPGCLVIVVEGIVHFQDLRTNELLFNIQVKDDFSCFAVVGDGHVEVAETVVFLRVADDSHFVLNLWILTEEKFVKFS